MPLGTRALWIDYANLLASDRPNTVSTTTAVTLAEKIAIANEVYQWLYLAGTPRVSYLSQAGFTHGDGTVVVADATLKIATQAANTLDTTLANIEEFFSVHFEGLASSDPGTIESVPRMEYLEHNEFLAVKATLADATAPKYVHWERLAISAIGSEQTSVGKWRLSFAPGKSQTAGAGSWYFSVVCRRSLSLPSTALSSGSPLSADGSVPELLPHETYLGARLTAYEILTKMGTDPKWSQRLVRNVPAYMMRSFIAARGLGEASVGSA